MSVFFPGSWKQGMLLCLISGLHLLSCVSPKCKEPFLRGCRRVQHLLPTASPWQRSADARGSGELRVLYLTGSPPKGLPSELTVQPYSLLPLLGVLDMLLGPPNICDMLD